MNILAIKILQANMDLDFSPFKKALIQIRINALKLTINLKFENIN